jgi:hypothetical protein
MRDTDVRIKVGGGGCNFSCYCTVTIFALMSSSLYLQGYTVVALTVLGLKPKYEPICDTGGGQG